MGELLSKISSYNIFNYLFPGALFVSIADWLQLTSLPESDIATLLLLYYVTGLTISRVGSVVVEPILRRSGFVKYASYRSFVDASRDDKKLEILVEVSNTYRTLATGFVVVCLWFIAHKLIPIPRSAHQIANIAVIVALACLYLFSFRKQAGFVRKRVEMKRED